MFAPLSTLKSSNGMAVRIQKAMNSALDRGDYARYDREGARLDQAMAAPSFEYAEFSRLCKAYGVDL